MQVCDEGDGGSTDSGPTSSNSEEECVFGVTTLIHLNYYRVSELSSLYCT